MSLAEAARPISEVVGGDRARPSAVRDADLPTTGELVSTLQSLFDRLHEAHDETVRMAQEYADAEHAFELAHSTARITAEAGEGTAGFKDALAKQSAAEKKRAMRLAHGLQQSARDAEENVRRELSALQTIAAAVRSEIELAGKPSRTV